MRWVLLIALVVVPVVTAQADPCPPSGAIVVVETAHHEIVLCEDGVEGARFAVSLGSGGVGKLKEGDHKTPLGSYPLAAPQGSSRFGYFIPIRYPTLEQTRRGLTGSDVGIHGPPRSVLGLARLVTAVLPGLARVDWTEGCVAVADDRTMDTIAAWVRSKRATRVDLR